MIPSRFVDPAAPVRVLKQDLGGTQRLVSAEQTLARVRPLLPVLGITRIANVTGLDRVGIPVTMVCRPNSRTLSVSQGKGIDLPSAQASGVMESVEAYHGERITLPLKLASYEELRYTHRLADPAQLPRLPGHAFDPYRPIHWIESYDLLNQQSVWLPYDLVHVNLTVGFERNTDGFVISSNGLAAGNHLLEAACHALCEVVERDATTLWYLADSATRAASRIDLQSIDDPLCCRVLECFERAGVLVGVWEISSDVGIPAFLCSALDDSDQPLRRLALNETMGCHPVREIALLRALTEAAQSRLTWIAGSRDDCFPEQYVAMSDADLNARKRAELLAPGPRRSFANVASYNRETFNEDLEWALQRLRAVGITQVLLVELTRPELRIPVVRVVIPGLEWLSSSQSYEAGARARARMQARA